MIGLILTLKSSKLGMIVEQMDLICSEIRPKAGPCLISKYVLKYNYLNFNIKLFKFKYFRLNLNPLQLVCIQYGFRF